MSYPNSAYPQSQGNNIQPTQPVSVTQSQIPPSQTNVQTYAQPTTATTQYQPPLLGYSYPALNIMYSNDEKLYVPRTGVPGQHAAPPAQPKKKEGFFSNLTKTLETTISTAVHDLDREVSKIFFDNYSASIRFRQYFASIANEQIIYEITCKAITVDTVLPGFLYLTRNYLCFYHEFGPRRVAVSIPLMEIVTLQKSYIARLTSDPAPSVYPISTMPVNERRVDEDFVIEVFTPNGRVHQFFFIPQFHNCFSCTDSAIRSRKAVPVPVSGSGSTPTYPHSAYPSQPAKSTTTATTGVYPGNTTGNGAYPSPAPGYAAKPPPQQPQQQYYQPMYGQPQQQYVQVVGGQTPYGVAPPQYIMSNGAPAPSGQPQYYPTTGQQQIQQQQIQPTYVQTAPPNVYVPSGQPSYGSSPSGMGSKSPTVAPTTVHAMNGSQAQPMYPTLVPPNYQVGPGDNNNASYTSNYPPANNIKPKQ